MSIEPLTIGGHGQEPPKEKPKETDEKQKEGDSVQK